ncbi:LRR receptor-like serine/threonine-protein kinase RCH1 [Punica granatum]|uniref:non-specific serine/threonine protein kinase n=1 Tax=Punica granatum TaxID=22663 RepID=A0A6P8E1L0_PUNGR|nr:LRR receptor-like serine/threonine-protein kinase RCH1 [Punica granatum]
MKFSFLGNMPMPRQSLNRRLLMPMPRMHSSRFRNLSHCHFHPLLGILILLFSALPLADAASSSDSNNEVLTLYSWLHSSSSNTAPPEALSSWNPLDSDPCGWAHITCSPEKFVTEINIQSTELALPFPSNFSSLPFLRKLVISGANVTGTISPDIGDCSRLEVLDFSSNSIVGGIPSSIGRLRNLQDLVLNSNQLTGKIPEEVVNCTNLKNLILFDNFLSGSLPAELGKLLNLEAIRAGGNKDISGEIPSNIGDCQNLRVLGLADTKISGSIPSSLGKLRYLQTLSIYTTLISGEIPPELGNCSELLDLYLYENDLTGSLPRELGGLQKLEKMLLWQNNLSGPIAEEIGNCRSLKIIDLSLNSFSGSIPESFGNLLSLEELMLSNNNISGSIPPVLANARDLIQLQLDTNQISGQIPHELGNLTKLTVFFAWQNRLEGSIPSELAKCVGLEALDLSHNQITGTLPPGLFQLRNLTKVLLISNGISGRIPPEIGSCSSLIRLRLSKNRVGGKIPREIFSLNNLSFLDLSDNDLMGSVPEEIGNCTSLQMLNLSNNSLGGTLPSSISSLSRLQVLDVSENHLEGQVPENLGRLSSLNRLNIRRNSISGSIPSSLGQCSNLQMLDLSSNSLSGPIPVELFEIKSLEIALNLSWNSFSGIVPPEISSLDKLSVLDFSHNWLEGDLLALSGLDNLVSLNISYNNFTGYLPDTKLFRQLLTMELAGNAGLCPRGRDTCFLGNATILGSAQSRNDSKESRTFKLGISLLVTLTVLLVILGMIAIVRARKIRRGEDNDSEMGIYASPWQFTPFQKKLNFSVDQVLKCLVEENVIGKGCSGIVYRAELGTGDVIAVKKLWPTTVANGDKLGIDSGVRDSFSAEVRTLGLIRHKNIVKFLGCCWNKNTRLLLYDYMPNGSLGCLLHERSGNCLEWDVRYRIVLGAAQGLAYLHHDCVPPIIHRDIKANNILIGPEFEPYIADFGLAKLVVDGDFARSSKTVAGSYGYIAPEYGYMMKITEKSDVYSFGVVMLEVLTGKQPIDPTIPDGLHIVDWVRQRRGGVEVLDPSLRARPDPEIEEMLQTVGVAMLCVNPSPNDRPTMKDVEAMLGEIRKDREEGMKVDMRSNCHEYGEEETSNGKRSNAVGSNNNASFSASSVLFSSSSSSNVKLDSE